MLYQVFAKGVRIANKIAESTCRIRPGLFFLISKKLHQENHTRSQMLIKHIVVETSITNREAGKLTGVSVRISTTLNSCSNQAEFKQFLIEKSSVSTQIADEVADFGSNVGVCVLDKNFEVVVDVSVMNWLVKIFMDAG